MKYYDSFTELITVAHRFSDYLKGCVKCSLIWITQEDIRALTEEDMEEIQRCLIDLDSLNFTLDDLKKHKILISHGLCAPCLKEALVPIYRKRQRAEGNPDCFGKSSGYCDQFGCDKYTLCVHNRLPGEGDSVQKQATAH